MSDAYNPAVDFKALRGALRAARNKKKWTLTQAAERASLDRATIHTVENVKREPDYKPELETVERLVLAYGMRLSAFFAELETRDAPAGERPAPNPRLVRPATIVTGADIERIAKILGETIGKSIQARESQSDPTEKKSGPFRRTGTAKDHARKSHRA